MLNMVAAADAVPDNNAPQNVAPFWYAEKAAQTPLIAPAASDPQPETALIKPAVAATPASAKVYVFPVTIAATAVVNTFTAAPANARDRLKAMHPFGS